MSEFIFMLTLDDVTVADALDQYAAVRDTDLRWVGFKDIGLPFETQRLLAERIRGDGRKVALEIVSLDAETEARSVALGIEMGVDLLMGGTHPDAVLPMLADTNVLYLPFVGRVVDHPSVLLGPAEAVAEDARRLSSRHGVHGLDLLAYRFDGDVPGLMRSVVRASAGPVVIAGSIDSEERIGAVRDSGAWGFTVGSAVFTGAFDAALDTRAQVQRVLDAAERGAHAIAAGHAGWRNPDRATNMR